MRKFLISAVIWTAAAGLAATAAQANYKGPHPVMRYHGNEYAVVINPASNGKSLVVYRAVGSLWQRIGGTIIAPGQKASRGGLAQDVWFKGRQFKTVRGDLRRPFYRHYNNHGAIDY